MDRSTLRATGAHRILVLPEVKGADLTYPDPGAVRAALAAIPFDAAMAWFDDAADLLEPEGEIGRRFRAIIAETSELPDVLLDAALATNALMIRSFALREIVDRELSWGDVPGSRLLEEWMPIDAPGYAGATAIVRETLEGRHGGTGEREVDGPAVRAFPTLQIHVTAGNAPVVGPASAARMLATRSGGVVKLPSGAVLPGVALGMALYHTAAGHPEAAALLDALSFVYWKGGDRGIEDRLFDPAVFDRVVVWGAPNAVERIAGLAAGAIKTITFMPRFGVSLVGREALADAASLADAARRAACDSLIWNQRACIASLVHYVEADSDDDARRYSEALRDALAECDEIAPSAPAPLAMGQIQRMRRGSLIQARWFTVGGPGRDLRAAVVLVPGPFDLGDHPLSRVVIVRRVGRLEEAVSLLHRGVSTVGVCPEPRRRALRDAIAARGVSNVFSLGQCERAFAGMPHDGMRVLSQLVDWANG